MVKVLHELAALDGGGDAKLLYDYYLHMDREKVHFDFLIYDFYDEGILEQPLRDLGCTIYKIPRIKKDKKGYLQGVKRTISAGGYDVVHSHMGARGLFTMFYARKFGVKKRIVHSHVAYEPVSKAKRCFNIMLSLVAKLNATHLFACGREAGIYMWGKKAVANGKVTVMTNAINTEAYAFSSEIRERKRAELGVEDKFVLGIVGRLSEQKNYPFLFDVYKRLLEVRKDVVLVIVGRGREEEEIKRRAEQLGLTDSILFLGVRRDVPELLNAFDLFVFPSLYEGLPVVLIEAQANGVKELVSDKVTKEMDITDLIQFLPIDNSQEQWVDYIVKCDTNVAERGSYGKRVEEGGYEIRSAAKKMECFYFEGANAK